MQQTTRTILAKKQIALVAHDHCKKPLIDWACKNKDVLQQHTIYATGTTGNLLQQTINIPINSMLSGPLGGDQQIGALISEKKIDMLIFLWDPLNAVPHDPDVKALLRLATVWNIPVATNIATADFFISSPLFNQKVTIAIPDYQAYLNERLK